MSTDEQTGGPPCPECGLPLYRVIDTRLNGARIRRRRRCLEGHKVTTYELIVGSGEDIEEAVTAAQEALDNVWKVVERSTASLPKRPRPREAA